METPKKKIYVDLVYRHEINREVFMDTMSENQENPELIKAINNTIGSQEVCVDNEEVLPFHPKEFDQENTFIYATRNRTFEAAQNHAKRGRRVAVLNFANNHTAGGGVWGGANAQEECLCRCSTLYPCITAPVPMEKFYMKHAMDYKAGKLDALGNDDFIYSPDVVVFKTDTPVPRLMDKYDWFKVDVITCAAPIMNHADIPEEEQYELFVKRFERIMKAASRKRITSLILGAFGCGAYGNNPRIVAAAAKTALEKYRKYFDYVEFAVYGTGKHAGNYEEFEKVFGDEASAFDILVRP